MESGSNSIVRKHKKCKNAVEGKNPKNRKRVADWTTRKGCSVVKYDPDCDLNFHDVDMDKVNAWRERKLSEYAESKKLIERLKKYLPRAEYTYLNESAITFQKDTNEGFRLLYDFHKIANKQYTCKYGDDETKVTAEYCELRKAVEEYIERQEKELEKSKKGDILDIVYGEVG